jgi:phytoene dehydrogenase-like protein
MLAASTWTLSVDQVLGLFGLRQDRPFRSLVAMLLQDTAQAGPETVPFANAAACLHAYRLGMSRPRGGMQALAEGIGERFAAMGGALRTATLVDRVEADGAGGFIVTTRRRTRIRTRQVAFNLPLDRAAALLGRGLDGRLGRAEARSRASWSACTAYLAIRRAAVPDDGPLFHQVLQSYDAPIHGGNNVLVSLSPLEDPGYGPADVRVATLSTHTRPADWNALDDTAHAALKAVYRERLLSALGRALPDAPGALVHAEFATPRSFARYLRRREGAVGGAPVRRGNSNFLAVGSDVLGPGLWVVGDSVFPGQGTMAVVLSAARVVERIAETPQRPAQIPSVTPIQPEPLVTA